MKSEKQIWNAACKATLKTISDVFSNKEYLDKLQDVTAKATLKSVGRLITTFPIPKYPETKKVKTKK